MAAINNYIDVVTLAATKQYLRFDDADASIDAELTAMINAACRLVEQYSSWRLKPQNLTYYFDHRGLLDVYDAPIQSIVTPAGFNTDDITIKGYYTQYCDSNNYWTDNVPLVLNVGYEDTKDVDPLLIQAVLETVRVWFYSAENDNQKGVLPQSALTSLNPIKRFIF